MPAADTNLEILPAIPDLRSRIATAVPWIRKAATAVADQGLTAGSNFVLGVVLARWLHVEQYGAYALAYSLYLLLSAFNQALLLEPLNVLGPSLYQDRLKQYLGRVLWIQAAVALAAMTLLLIAASVTRFFGHADFSSALYGLALAAPAILTLACARAACYVESAPSRAAAGAILYCALMLGGIWLAYRNSIVSPFAVFLLMGFAALCSSLVLFAQLKPRFAGDLTVRQVWRDHWNYGRWAIGSTLVTWIPGNIFYSVTGVLLGMGDAGAYRVLRDLELPVTHAASAFSLVFLPHLSRTIDKEGFGAARKQVQRVMLIYAAAAAAYAALFVAGENSIFRALYGGKFMEFSWLVPWILLGVVFQVGSYGPCVGLRAARSPASVFRVYGVTAAVALIAGIPATWAFGVTGAAATTVLANVTCFAMAVYLFRKVARASACFYSSGAGPAQQGKRAR